MQGRVRVWVNAMLLHRMDIKMQKITYCLFLLIAALCWSCSKDKHTIIPEAGANTLVMTVNVMEPLTRATEPGADPLNENAINELSVFMFKGEQLVWYVEEVNVRYSADTKKLMINVPAERISMLSGQALDIVVLANGPSREAYSSVTTLSGLKAVSHTSADFLTIDVNPLASFLMDGSIRTPALTLGSVPFNVGNINLSRSASKIRIHIDQLSISGYTPGQPEIKLINIADKTSLLPGSPSAYAGSGALKASLYTATVSADGIITTRIPFYSYENNWDSESEKETFAIIKVPFSKDGRTLSYYYRVPVNYRLAVAGMTEAEKQGLYKLQRNHLYDVTVKISKLGNETEDKPLEVLGYIAVKEWNEPPVIDAQVIEAHYLNVKEREVIMANQTERLIEYASDLPVQLLSPHTEYTAYEFVNGRLTAVVKKDQNLSALKLSLRIVNGLKYVVVNNPAPANFVPVNISFYVNNGLGLVQKIKIIQYPPRFITAGVSNGAHYAGYFGINSDFPSPFNPNLFTVNTQVSDGVNSKIGDPVGSNGRTLTDAASNALVSPKFIIASQYGVTNLTNSYGVNATQERASNHCYEFYEDSYGPGQTYGGRWRLPTSAELAYINRLQRNSSSAVKNLLTGEWYWSAKTGKAYNFNTQSEGVGFYSYDNYFRVYNYKAYIRCVYDIYKYE